MMGHYSHNTIYCDCDCSIFRLLIVSLMPHHTIPFSLQQNWQQYTAQVKQLKMQFLWFVVLSAVMVVVIFVYPDYPLCLVTSSQRTRIGGYLLRSGIGTEPPGMTLWEL